MENDFLRVLAVSRGDNVIIELYEELLRVQMDFITFQKVWENREKAGMEWEEMMAKGPNWHLGRETQMLDIAKTIAVLAEEKASGVSEELGSSIAYVVGAQVEAYNELRCWSWKWPSSFRKKFSKPYNWQKYMEDEELEEAIVRAGGWCNCPGISTSRSTTGLCFCGGHLSCMHTSLRLHDKVG